MSPREGGIPRDMSAKRKDSQPARANSIKVPE